MAGVKKLYSHHRLIKSFKLDAYSDNNSFALLVCQSACKVVLDVGVYYRSEVVEPAVPEQVNDEHLSTQIRYIVFPLQKKCQETIECVTPAAFSECSYQRLENERSVFISVVV